jgi:opacity protein-like surface antigen
MKRWMTRATLVSAIAVTLATMTMTTTASAQNEREAPGKLELTLIPAGATFVTSRHEAPNFTNYDAGVAFAYNFDRRFGVEGEAVGSFGLKQSVSPFGGTDFTEEKTPNLLSYSANFVATLPTRAVMPYATAGIGGTTLYQREVLRIFKTDSFVTSNFGGGLKWYAPNGRWGVRGDYRLQYFGKRGNAPDFFGDERRIAHRVYGAVLVTVKK